VFNCIGCRWPENGVFDIAVGLLTVQTYKNSRGSYCQKQVYLIKSVNSCAKETQLPRKNFFFV